MKKLLASTIFILFYFSAYSNIATRDSLLMELDKAIENEKAYTDQKFDKIAHLKNQLGRTGNDLVSRYKIYDSIFDEYKSFNYDSAFNYILKLQKIGYQLGNPTKIASTKVKTGFIFLSSGMFKEAFDSLNTIDETTLPRAVKKEYYKLLSILYYGMSDLNDRHYSTIYDNKGHQYTDSVIKYSYPGSYDLLYSRGLQNTRKSNHEAGIKDLNQLIKRDSLTMHQKAIIASTMSDIYLQMEDMENGTTLLAQAAIFDIHSATKETAAILTLADILYQQGDIKRAYTYTKKALADANFYGARHRKIQVGTILPIIEEEKINTVESQKRLLIIYATIVTILSISVVVFVFIILKQLRKLKTSDKKIVETNIALQETNHKLLEANKIKEEYIGYYFNINSDYLEKIEKLKRAIDKNLLAHKYDNVKYIVNNIDLRKERIELYQNFDKVFLKLFPDFISNFNALFKPEDQIKLSENELLNTDLRIFALIRMGITENDKIAKILEFSVNTIYAYKTKIKKKSIVPNEEFEKKIMAIKPI